MTEVDQIRVDLHTLVADVLELEPGQLAEDENFVDAYGMDSLLGIEMAARIDKEYGTELSVRELARMTDLRSVQEVVLEHLRGR